MLHYLTRSVRRRAATSKRIYLKLTLVPLRDSGLSGGTEDARTPDSE
jgi:hypothetical protein